MKKIYWCSLSLSVHSHYNTILFVPLYIYQSADPLPGFSNLRCVLRTEKKIRSYQRKFLKVRATTLLLDLHMTLFSYFLHINWLQNETDTRTIILAFIAVTSITYDSYRHPLTKSICSYQHQHVFLIRSQSVNGGVYFGSSLWNRFFLTVNFAIHKSLPFSGLYVEI